MKIFKRLGDPEHSDLLVENGSGRCWIPLADHEIGLIKSELDAQETRENGLRARVGQLETEIGFAREEQRRAVADVEAILNEPLVKQANAMAMQLQKDLKTVMDERDDLRRKFEVADTRFKRLQPQVRDLWRLQQSVGEAMDLFTELQKLRRGEDDHDEEMD